ncbi:tonsoku-like protein, partial [Diaphorina citri]|uniref:Tonsoku-like protein n=1 Tax=Diaphorina citri TaxID=121845 RepID=A0A1S3DQ12_DIACI
MVLSSASRRPVLCMISLTELIHLILGLSGSLLPIYISILSRWDGHFTSTRRGSQWISGGETALHVAAARGNLTLVQSLLKQGHPVKVQDSAGWLPLHEAANHGHTDIVQALVSAGADPNDK